MNAIIELIVNSTGGTAQGIVNLHGDEPIQLNLSVADIKDITQRKGSYSQSFVVPGTTNNNELFNFLFEIGIDGQFNPAHKTPCQLLVDTIPVIANGVLQLTDISVDDHNNISYMVTVFDSNGDLVDAIGTLELADMNFSGFNQTWNTTNILNSWTGSSQPIYYPLIDYGYDLNMTTLQGSGMTIGQFFPAIQAKTYVDMIFSGAGYSYNSNFFNSDYFKNLYIPYNGSSTNILQDANVIASNSFNGVVTADTKVWLANYPTHGSTYGVPFTSNFYKFGFNNDTIAPGFNNGTYDAVNSFWTPNTTLAVSLSVTLNYEFTYVSAGGGTSTGIQNCNIIAEFRRDGVPICQVGLNGGPFSLAHYNTNYTSTFTSVVLDGPLGTVTQPPTPNDVYDVHFYVQGTGIQLGNFGNSYLTVHSGTSMFFNTVYPIVVPNSNLIIDSFVPKKVKQIDFLNSIFTMHNMWVIPDKNNSKVLTIEPRDEYLKTGVILDWSDKLDLSQSVQENLLSEQQNKRIVFSYAADKDFFNDNYTTATNKIFGDEYVVLDNDFTKDDQNINLIFSPTPSVAVLDSAFVAPPYTVGTANDFVIPKIGKVDSNNHFGSTDFNIRILQKFSGNTVNLSGSESWNFNGTGFTYYPYLGMLSHPYSNDPFVTDIAFGQVDFEYYQLSGITSNNLVNKYYRTYINQIIDKDSKLITAEFYLTPADINQFTFADTVFVDGLGSDGMGAYFLVNNIIYTPTSNGTSTVELILVKELVSSQSTYNSVNHRLMGPLQVVSMGGGQTSSTGSIAMGPNVIIGAGSAGSLAIGNNLSIGGGSPSNLLMGSGSSISAGVSGSISIGNGNVNYNGSNSLLFGNNITVGTYPVSGNTSFTGTTGSTGTTVSGVTVFGNNITATTSNTVYVNNLNISSGGTINNIVISAITAGAGLWTSGTSGHQSVQALNDSGLFASNDYAYAEGNNTKASGITSHAEGSNTTAGGTGSHSEGETTAALGVNSHAEGRVTVAFADHSHAEGNQTTAIGLNSHTEGSGTTAIGDSSHAEGSNSFAIGRFSHAEGFATTAQGHYSHSEGELSIAAGMFSHAGGINSIAFTEGEWTRASNTSSLPLTQYGIVHLIAQTGNATPQEAFADWGFDTQRFQINFSSTYRVKMTVIATLLTGAGGTVVDAKEWSGDGLIKNVSGTVSLVGPFTLTSANGDVSLSTASVAATADNTNKALAVTVTGVAASFIDWSIRCDYVSVG